jgi:adenine/guanine phosphoribosyltransferase-like PRPP-binding protein
MSLSEEFLAAGLVLFGDFADADGGRKRYSLRFDLLASYPHILSTLADAIAPSIGATYSRLLCPFDALPLGTALALRTGIPLVYSRGRGESAVVDFVGAYDIGHRALLIVNAVEVESSNALAGMITRAAGVGLDVVGVQAILRVGEGEPDLPATQALFRLDEFTLIPRRDLEVP